MLPISVVRYLSAKVKWGVVVVMVVVVVVAAFPMPFGMSSISLTVFETFNSSVWPAFIELQQFKMLPMKSEVS
jgi:hypothetical protein